MRQTDREESLERDTNSSSKESIYESDVMEKRCMRGVWGVPASERI